MKVCVKLFAVAREIAGRDVVEVELAPGATIADLRRTIAAEQPALSNVLSHALWAVDATYAGDDICLNERSNVALIPPVSGG